MAIQINNSTMYFYAFSSVLGVPKELYKEILDNNVECEVIVHCYTSRDHSGSSRLMKFTPYDESRSDKSLEYYSQPRLVDDKYDVGLFVTKHKIRSFLSGKELNSYFIDRDGKKVLPNNYLPKEFSWRFIAKGMGYYYGPEQSMDWRLPLDRFGDD